MSDLAIRPRSIVVMGVAGSGKSTVAALLAMMLAYEFQEGDLLHPAENVAKMRGGTPLADADRLIWLNRVAATIDGWRRKAEGGVISCSALKRSYRDVIIGERRDVSLVYLKGSYELIHARLAARHEHFMPVALLDSQFAILEEPTPDERPIVVDVDGTPASIAAEIVKQLGLANAASSQGGGVGPGHKLIDAARRPAIDELGQHIGEPGVRIDAIEFASLKERRQTCPVLGPLIVSGEETILAI